MSNAENDPPVFEKMVRLAKEILDSKVTDLDCVDVIFLAGYVEDYACELAGMETAERLAAEENAKNIVRKVYGVE